MNRIIAVCFSLVFVISSYGCKKEQPKTEAPRVGLVNFITGDVKIVGESGVEKAANIGDEVKQGMKIKTKGKKSAVDVYFGENAVKIIGDTVVEIKVLMTNIAKNTESTELYVENGSVFSKLKKISKEDSYNVKTPTTTAGVRGTDFLVSEQNGKSNIACLNGKVEVKNDGRPGSAPVTIIDKQEVDVSKDKDMIAKQLSDDKLRALNILTEIKAMREEIWEKNRKIKEEIFQHVKDQKEKDKTVLDNQREGDKKLVDDQKKLDKENIDKIKGDTAGKSKEATDAAKGQMDAAKNVNKDAGKDEAKSKMEGMKPKIEKTKIDKSSMKPNM
jgi:hypothetical protein